MTQADRDRLVTLRKAKKRLITRREAAAELGLSLRQVKRLVKALKKRGDRAVIHGLRGKPSNGRLGEELRSRAMEILSQDVYRGFGPTLAAEYLGRRHGLEISRETLRQWMIAGGLWRAHAQTCEEVHLYRARRSRCGELVQWDTSDHDWLEGRGPRIYLIAMIDDATSRLYARFVASDSTEENMLTLWGYLERYGRPLAFYTDRASLFQSAVKTKRGQEREGRDQPEMAPTQIGRALRELDIVWIPAYSPQAKGRVERGFRTAQDRLVKGLRVAGVRGLEEANGYLQEEFLPWWNATLTVAAANPDDAHRKLDSGYHLAAILSHVETRQVKKDYTIQFQRRLYQIDRGDICTGLRGAAVRMEERRDGSVAIRFRDKYLRYRICEGAQLARRPTQPAAGDRSRKGPNAGGKSKWMEGFLSRPGPSLEKAIAIANATS